MVARVRTGRHDLVRRPKDRIVGLDRQAHQRLQEKEVVAGVQMNLCPTGLRIEVDPARGVEDGREAIGGRPGEVDFGEVALVEMDDLPT